MILWFGWYGFNPGSTLSAMDFEGIGRIATNTTLAACAGALVAMFYIYFRTKKWDLGISINGLLAGLVAITCPCYWVSPSGSLAIGAVAGIVVVLAVDFTEWVRIDDPCGAFAVHGCRAGHLGDVEPRPSGPLRRDANQLIAQGIKGSAVITFATLAAGLLLMFLVKAMRTLRISPKARSRVSTSTSTVRRRTTPSSPTWATRRCRRASRRRVEPSVARHRECRASSSSNRRPSSVALHRWGGDAREGPDRGMRSGPSRSGVPAQDSGRSRRSRCCSSIMSGSTNPMYAFVST